MVGPNYLGRVKLLSIFVVVPLVLIVTKLVDLFPRHRILYGISIVYAVISVGFAMLIMHPTLGIANTVASTDRILGWAFYLHDQKTLVLLKPGMNGHPVWRYF
jgi:hypothetical protein